MSDSVRVIFRTFINGDVIALFPYEEHAPGLIVSYQRIGQHAPAPYHHVMRVTKPSKPDEIEPLKRELEDIGYKLQIIKGRGTEI